MTAVDYERALSRLPKWMIVLGVPGTGLVVRYAGLSGGTGFLLGALAAWLNLQLIERGVDRIIRMMASEPGKVRARSGVRMFAQFAVIAAIALVILKFTGFNLMAALLGFLVCPAAVLVEIVYELFSYGHS